MTTDHSNGSFIKAIANVNFSVALSWRFLTFTGLLLACVLVPLTVHAETPTPDSKPVSVATRTFVLDYGITIDNLQTDDEVKLWLPVPQSNRHQHIESLSQDLPGQGGQSKEPKYGNEIIYRSIKITDQNQLSAQTRYNVRRNEVVAEAPESKREALSEHDEKLYLSANAKVPTTGLPIKWLINSNKFSVARQIYDRVDKHVRYDKSQPGYGNGDVLWVCDSRFGNCTDFHSLFIAMARASKIPARFEIGFPIPTDKTSGQIGGYHCWASFYDKDRGWFPVDISEADKHPELKEYYFGHLSADRVGFSVGRDIDLVPQQKSPPLNYFVYPHVEVNGAAVDKSQLAFQFSFQNVASSAEQDESN